MTEGKPEEPFRARPSSVEINPETLAKSVKGADAHEWGPPAKPSSPSEGLQRLRAALGRFIARGHQESPQPQIKAQGGTEPLRRISAAEEAGRKRKEEEAKATAERAKAIIKGQEVIKRARITREAAVTEALRPKTLTEMAASRRGNLTDTALRESVKDDRETGPLPSSKR
jgi:hypothetical protein